jgi:hypothetical protein
VVGAFAAFRLRGGRSGHAEAGIAFAYSESVRPAGISSTVARCLHEMRRQRAGALAQRKRSTLCLCSSESLDQLALSREPNLAARNFGSPSFGSPRGGGSPRLERFVSEDAKRATGCQMALDVESVLDGGVNRQEALG